ncbi:glutathione-dependent formaldehyde dehydrogenase [Frankia sp. CNm7]|uniref:Glutathione-dependent formaldehyde dehydrogenase n=1 Tax=Frankia nepalensis TaxID=1836974 RepID=A0A937UUH6_9ACTN|nr:zinc-dependent alcohol dehydrogenase [Frankia nepalensis]MBL7498077.1 glutathione-dependent formaldehyde dehydrogenase [Frankia nepalensis]MBL7509307.1 glutathione-dependent formaldehyde dehydrogenase [Frankia nepalensis]MBL7519284.1 glutathione-dependent formaldehyde dehydrogenase [Frankia nepalensis]MBL7632265.1 glutathione-dependent formaldehyde dehydrogenase [Frankia nepalensis]
MRAVVWHGVGDIRLDTVAEPKIEQPTDAVVRITTAAICGTDLHFVRGTVPGMKPGIIIGHEGVGVVEEVGRSVRNVRRGDRVLLSAVLGCGSCSYCRSGYFAQCDDINPYGRRAGSGFYGAPKDNGSFDGLQAEYARVPYAHTNLFRLPDSISDDQAIPLSDIYPTGYFGAVIAEVSDGDVVAVWGCGPVGQFAILSAFQRGATRVIAVDGHADRLERAQALGAEVVNFNEEEPVEALLDLTRGIGPDRAIDAVGVDAESPKSGPAAARARAQDDQHRAELREIAPETNEHDGHWKPGDAPTQAHTWAVESLAKAGTLGIVGVYPPTDRFFPIGTAMNKNLTINMGNGNHPRYIPKLLAMVESGVAHPEKVLTQHEPMRDVLAAYEEFDLRRPGWLKVALDPAS